MKPEAVDLPEMFETLNRDCFAGVLSPLPITWNSRLRTTAGRFVSGHRKLFRQRPPRIEIASYLLEETNAEELIRDTLAHEMIHYWLWARRRPFGHTAEFYAKMRELGVSRYNPVPRQRPYKYLYKCPSCTKAFPARRRLALMACRTCCDEKSGGRYDSRFKLMRLPYQANQEHQ